MTVKKSFPWKTILFLLFLGTSAFVVYDVTKQGNWEKSQSVQTLKQIGVWEYGEKTWDKANQGLNWTRQRIEAYAPGYIDLANECIHEYLELGRDFGFVLYNLGDDSLTFFKHEYPGVFEYIEVHVPATLNTVQKNAKEYAGIVAGYGQRGYEYLTTEVFIGEMSPENMQKHVVNAINTTQTYAIEYYHWIYKKIDDTINAK